MHVFGDMTLPMKVILIALSVLYAIAVFQALLIAFLPRFPKERCC